MRSEIIINLIIIIKLIISEETEVPRRCIAWLRSYIEEVMIHDWIQAASYQVLSHLHQKGWPVSSPGLTWLA